jgi:membrane dipeptidase
MAHRARFPFAIALLTSLVFAGASRGDSPAEEPPIAVVDLHVDLPWQVHKKGRSPSLDKGNATRSAMTAGHYVGLVFPIYLWDKRPGRAAATIEDADAIFATVEKIIAEGPSFLPLKATHAEPEKISTFLAIEGAGCFAKDLTAIDRFLDRGLRFVSPCHGANSELASSATGAAVKWGLTPLGKELAERVYQKGALLDVSHVSDRSFDDIAAIARKYGAPVVATHSNARALADVPRNLTDAQLRVIGESGGVAGLNFNTKFIADREDASIADLVKQAQHMIAVAGVDHVAIGSDYDGDITPPKGLTEASGLPALAAALKKSGMSHDDVLKVFSLNALRVLGWRPAAGMFPDAGAPDAGSPEGGAPN